MNTWIISDTHFKHENIIGYCKRPFKNANHMDCVIRDRWNQRVKPEDLVYHDGDVMRTANLTDEELYSFITSLNGKKILILGNHDKSAKRMMEFGFDFACEEMVISYHNYRLLLTHKPRSWMPGNVDYVLHGHIHNSTPAERKEHATKGELVEIPAFNINMCVEMWNYEPVTLEHVLKTQKFKERGMKAA